MLVKTYYKSPLGDLSLVASDRGLVGIWFMGQKYFEHQLGQEPILGSHPILEQASRCLDQYFSGQSPDLSQLPLDVRGTNFQKKVWSILQTIPFGETISYGAIGERLGVASGQAIGGAVGRNPISILIPCHRVLSKAGKLTGYAGGLDKKIWLLKHEGIVYS